MTTVETDLERLTTVLSERSARFRFDTEAPMGARSLASLADPLVAGGLVDHHARARGLDRVRSAHGDAPVGAAALLTVHAIASRILSVVLAGVVLERRLVVAPRDAVHVAPRRRSFALGITHGEVEEVDDVAVGVVRAVDLWVDGHLAMLIDDVRRARRVPRSLLRGHVAEAVLATLALLDWWEPGTANSHLASQLLTSPTSLLAASSRASVTFDGRRDGVDLTLADEERPLPRTIRLARADIGGVERAVIAPAENDAAAGRG